MEVRLKSELPPNANPTVVTALVLFFVAATVMTVFGTWTWYFPKPSSRWLAVPTTIAGLYLAAVFNRYTRDVPRSARHRGGAWAMYVFMPSWLGMCFVIGAPSAWLRLMGPDQTLQATVVRSTRGSNSCGTRLFLRGGISTDSGFCVENEEAARMPKGSRVRLEVREGVFGTLAFSMKPAIDGPE